MSLNVDRPNKIDHIYIVPDDFVFKQLEPDCEKKGRIEKLLSQGYKNDYLTILNGLDYINLESINAVGKNKKDNIKKLNREHIVTIFKCMGFNLIYCPQIAEGILSDLFILINIKFETIPENYFTSSVIIKHNIFFDIAKKVVAGVTGSSKCHLKKYFNLSYIIINKKIPIILLIGGTSGTGKSTVASLIASRLGIATVLSTDSIRHILRNFYFKEEMEAIFASTYDTWKTMKHLDEGLSHNKKVIKGYCEQSKVVLQHLENVIDNFIQRQESLVIEGVHLSLDFMINIVKKYKYTFPFLIYIDKEEKHKERFAIRAKQMTLDAKYNKYVQNLGSIRAIQGYLLKKADGHRLPKIDNSNIDKSIGMMHETILKAFKDIFNKKKLNFNTESHQFDNLYNKFMNFNKNVLSSKEANILISQKVNKNFLLEKFFGHSNSNVNESVEGVYKKECHSDNECQKVRSENKTTLFRKNYQMETNAGARKKVYFSQRPKELARIDNDVI
jgi:2-phosphoglycerate kinase